VRARKARHIHLVIAIGIAAVAVRLIAINQPFIDPWSWRQSDVAAIARNFYQNGFHFVWPQIDWAGDQPGYVGTEFPVLPFIAAICYKLVGVHEWIGRIQAVILFAASLPFFFLLVCEVFDATAATWAMFFYSFAPLNVVASREFMPDVPSLGLAIIGLYFFLRWTDNQRSWSLSAAAIAISLALLIKLPTAIIGAPLLYLTVAAVCDRRTSGKSSDGQPPSPGYGAPGRPPPQEPQWRWCFRQIVREPKLWVFTAIVLLPSVVWYWHAHQIAENFYPYHMFGAGGIQIEDFSWYWKIAKHITTSTLTPLLFALAVLGAFMARTWPERQPNGSTRNGRAFHWWFAAMIFFIVVVGYGNRHQWYQLPLVPIAAAFAGVTCAFMATKLASPSMRMALSILLVGSFGFLACVYARPFYRPISAELRDTGLELKRTTPQNSLIIAADNGDPTAFYYAERKGWHFLEKDGIYEGNPGDSQQVIADLEKLRRRGATHLVFIASTFWWLDYYTEFAEHIAQTTTLARATPEFKIYKLNP
jgi:4-amino-4-deoxy-L-arabinose transferase-like glycosyltransferase